MRTDGSAQELQQVRMIAANLFELDKTTREIVACLKVDDQTVRRWRRIWRTQGRAGLQAKPHPGRPALLDDAQRQQLTNMLAGSPVDHGFADQHCWTTPLIAGLIERHFGVRYTADWVGQLLHAMGFTWQKPARRARERDEARIEAWRREVWPTLLKKTPRSTV